MMIFSFINNNLNNNAILNFDWEEEEFSKKHKKIFRNFISNNNDDDECNVYSSSIHSAISDITKVMKINEKSGNNYDKNNSTLPYSSSYSRVILALKNYLLE